MVRVKTQGYVLEVLFRKFKLKVCRFMKAFSGSGSGSGSELCVSLSLGLQIDHTVL